MSQVSELQFTFENAQMRGNRRTPSRQQLEQSQKRLLEQMVTALKTSTGEEAPEVSHEEAMLDTR